MLALHLCLVDDRHAGLGTVVLKSSYANFCYIQQAADTAAIRTAITEEARSRGLEHTLKEERPPAARRRLPAGILNAGNEQLLQLLQQAFDGQLPGLQLNVSGAGQAGEDAEAEEDEVSMRC